VVGRLWTLAIDPARTADFERIAGDEALRLAQAGMGCVAVFALRETGSDRYAWLTFWVSRRALAVALQSREWAELAARFAELGASLEESRAASYETLGVFLAGERDPASGADRGRE
jgi:heme-degrading monooxygenase HmoA